MARRRKRRKKLSVVRRVKRPARYFNCPVCHEPTLTIDFKKSDDKPATKIAIVRCGSCGLNLTMEVPEVYERVDVYGIVVDKAHSGELEEALEAATADEASSEAENVEEEEGAELPTEEEVRY